MKPFREITILVPDYGDYMVHLDETDKPIRIYVYTDMVNKNYNPEKFQPSKNPVFMDIKKLFIQKTWNWLKGWRVAEDEIWYMSEMCFEAEG